MPSIGFAGLGEWLLELSLARFVLLCVAVTVFRDGFWLYESDANFVAMAAGFPHDPTVWYESWLYLLLPNLLGATTLVPFMVLYGGVTVVCLVLLVALPVRQLGGELARFFVVAVVASGLPEVIVYEVGFYDVLTVLGVLVIVTCRRTWLVVLGAALMSGSNPPLAIVAAVAFLVLTGSARFRRWRDKSLVTLAVTAAGWVGADLWLHAIGGKGEISYLGSNLSTSATSFLYSVPLAISSWFGAAWVFVAAAIAAHRDRRSRLAMASALVVIPAIAAIATLDDTRVFVTVAALPFLVVVWDYCTARRSSSLARAETSASWRMEVATWTGILALATIIVPSLYVRGDTRSVWLPWAWVVSGGHFLYPVLNLKLPY